MSDDYVPTAKLRFVERRNDPRSGEFVTRILQQYWEPAYIKDYGRPLAGMPAGEWRDVSMETEHA